MQYVFQFARILMFCFLGELVHLVLPLPIPASVYGLVLMLAALKLNILKPEKIREASRFLISLFPLLFVPPAVGTIELSSELKDLLIPIIIVVIPGTILVCAVAGRTTQSIVKRRERV